MQYILQYQFYFPLKHIIHGFRFLLRFCPFYNQYLLHNFWDTNKNDAPVTTGRFVISEHIGNKIILTKNSSWWNLQQDNSIIEKITINFYSSIAELYNAFRQGSIDLISTKNNDYKKYIGKIGYKTTEVGIFHF